MERGRKTLTHALALAIAVALIATTGCSGEGGDESGGTPPVASGDVMAILHGVEQRLDELDGQPPDDVAREMRAWLAATNAFAAVGVASDGTVWGRFPDGVLYVVGTNRPPQPVEASDDAVGGAREELRAALPASIAIHAATTLEEPRFHPAALEVLDWATGNGYAEAGRNASVEALERVIEAGVVYIDTHGGLAPLTDGTEAFVLWTSTVVTDESRRQYESRLRSGELVLYTEHSGVARESRIGITARFVSEHMRFSPDSFVFINACSSNHESMRRAFLEAGAGTYAGWTHPVDEPDAVRVGRLVLDRLLGRNVAYLPFVGDADRERRPFTLEAIQEELRALGWNPVTSSSPEQPNTYQRGSRNVVLARPSRPIVRNELVFTAADPTVSLGLAPSIMDLRVDEAAHTLTVTGQLGAGVDRVTFAGHPLRIVSTTQVGLLDQLVADLPNDAPFSGAVVVESRGRRSNAKTLTGWTMHVQWTRTTTTAMGSYAYDADCSFSFRAMPRGARTIAGNEPLLPHPIDRVELADRSSCTFGATGSETWMTGTTTHVATYEAARTDPVYATELQNRSGMFLQLDLDGRWSLNAPIQQRDVVRRTIDGSTSTEPISAGIAIEGRFDPEVFDLPGGSLPPDPSGVELRWETAHATPTPERGEGFAYPQ